jgi:hypothetical protein
MKCNFSDDELKEALLSVNTYYLNNLPKEEDIIHQFSYKFKNRMKRLIKQSKKKETTARPFSLQKRIAIAIIIIIIMPAVIINASTLQRAVFKFVINVYEKYTEIFYDKNSSPQPIIDEKFKVYKPTYIPDGFSIHIEDEDESVYLEYIKDNDYIIYEQKRNKDLSMHFNTEGIIVEDIEINGHTGIYFSNKEVQFISWYDDIYVYSVTSSLGKDDLYSIAKSVPQK